jgi:hypothetical protein
MKSIMKAEFDEAYGVAIPKTQVYHERIMETLPFASNLLGEAEGGIIHSRLQCITKFLP